MRLVAVAMLVLSSFLLARPAAAQEPNRAGLVVQYGDGNLESTCVEFEDSEISGLDLLQRSGLPLTYDAQAGATVCSIRGEGCNFPAQACFCECAGIGTCVYWSYHRLQPDGEWLYSQLGAGASRVAHGDVDGWRWIAGRAEDAPPPPEITFDSICEVPATDTPAPEPVVEALEPQAPVAEPEIAPPEEPVPATTLDSSIEPPLVEDLPAELATAEQEATTGTGSYMMFGALVGVLIAAIVWSRRSR
jgi:hypothetical protein